jgi:sensor histidine kinase YesM
MFSNRYRYLFVLLLSVYTFLNTELCEVYHYFNIEIEWYYALLTILFITGLTWEGNRLLEPLIRKLLPPERNKLRFLAGFFVTGNIFGVVVVLLMVYIMGTKIHGYSWKQNINPLKLNVIYVSLANLFFHLVNAVTFFFREYQKKWKEAEEFRRVSATAELELIKSQINPHFLFNNLNVLSGMVIKDNPEANRFIEEFSKVYRYILNNQQKEVVQLQSELEFIQPYIFLLQKRFDNGLKVDIQIEKEFNNFHIVPASLQMLIENAIKHNVVSRNKPLHIDIYTDGNKKLVVKNNLQPRNPTEPSGRLGLQNIRKRYELICGHTIVVSKTNTEFTAVLPLLLIN